jgi:hypothetical protein
MVLFFFCFKNPQFWIDFKEFEHLKLSNEEKNQQRHNSGSNKSQTGESCIFPTLNDFLNESQKGH